MSYLRFHDSTRLNYLFALILAFSLVGCSGGDGSSTSLSLSWVVPSERVDGSTLSLSEIAKFRIYYGAESGNYSNTIDIDDHTATQAVIDGVPSGTFFAVITTVDTDGRESSFSVPELEVTF